MAVGNILPEPESGWKRIDDSNTAIGYLGDWFDDRNDVYYNNSMRFTFDNTAKIIINVVCSKIRIVQHIYTNRTQNAVITIDGEKYNYSTYGGHSAHFVVYENTELKYGNHIITISSPDISKSEDVSLGFDSMDIDDDGYLLDISYMTKRIVGEHIFYGGIDSSGNYIESETFVDVYNDYKTKNLSLLSSKISTPYKILRITKKEAS